MREALPESRGKRWIAVALVVVAFGWLGFTLLDGLDVTPVHGDESWWLYYTRYFRDVVRGDFSNPEWTTGLAVDQPHLAKFVFGAALWVTGKLDAIPEHPWEYSITREANEAMGNVPRADVLRVGRLTSVAFALLAAAASFVIACRLSGLPGGLLVVLFLSFNNLFVRCGRRAMPDMMFVCFVLIGVDLAIRFVQRVRADEWRRAAWLAAGVGVAGFAATATKLNGAVVFLVFAAAALYAGTHRAVTRGFDRRVLVVALGSPIAAAALGFVLFALIHPLVLRSPIDGSRQMLEWRLSVIDRQRAEYPARFLENGEPTIAARIDMLETRTLAGRRSARNFTTFGAAGPIAIDLVLFIVGLGALLALEVFAWIRGRAPTAMGVLLAFTAIAFACTLVWIGVDWDRYYLLVIPPIALVSTFLPGEIVRLATRLTKPSP